MAQDLEATASYFTDDQMLTEFTKLAELGVIEYIVPSEPLGKQWVVGFAGRIANMTGNEAGCFLLGASAVATYDVERFGLDSVI